MKTRINRLRTGQTVHCPDCGHGFPVTDAGAADELERAYAENSLMREALERVASGEYDAHGVMSMVARDALDGVSPASTRRASDDNAD